MGLAHGVVVSFHLPPTPRLHISDNGLPAIRDVDVLHRDCLLSAGPMLSQSFYLGSEGSGEFIEAGIVRLDLW